MQSLGIRREDKNQWEARVPLNPADVKTLIEKTGMTVKIQPSTLRTYTDEDYTAAGAEVTEDIWGCDLVIAVKEIPARLLQPNRAYLYFSHTIKGQPYNMAMLKKILDENMTLLDYEPITNDAGKRLIFFSSFAGYAGMIDSLWALGRRLNEEGLDTAISDVRMTHKYTSLTEAQEDIRRIGKKIEEDGLPKALTPLVIAFTGNGQVSQGAQSIAKLMPHEMIPARELPTYFDTHEAKTDRVYLSVIEEADMVEPNDPAEAFDLQTYYTRPEGFHSVFERYLPHVTMVINGIFWTERYPRLVTKDSLKALFEKQGRPSLRVLGDISCDIEGSFETTIKATYPADPCYTYNPDQDRSQDGVLLNGVVTMAVDNLPCELAREASDFFSERLLPLLVQMNDTDFGENLDTMSIPDEMRRAVIVHRGALTPRFAYIEDLMNKVLQA